MDHTLGQTIAATRRAKGLRQWQLAEMIGIRQTSLSRIEAGQIIPSMATLEKISTVLNIPYDELRQKALEIIEAMAKCPRVRRGFLSRGSGLN